MQTIQPTIYRQRVLPPKITQQMLPAITADTTQIHKMIEEQYGKTVILPETHSFHVTNYDENSSKEMINSLFSQNPTYAQPQPTLPQPSLPQPTLPQPSLFQSSFYQPPLVTYQPVIYNSTNPNFIQRKNVLFQPIMQRRIILPQNQNPLLIRRNAPILSSINLPYSSATF